MCHNSVLENEQIDKCVENGMPKKIVKSLQFTIKKRIEQYENQQINNNNNNNNNNNYNQRDRNHDSKNDNKNINDNYERRSEKIQKNSFVECLDQLTETTIIKPVIPVTSTPTLTLTPTLPSATPTITAITNKQTTVDGIKKYQQQQHQQPEKQDTVIIHNNGSHNGSSGTAGSLIGLCGRFRSQNSSNIIKDFGIEGITNIFGRNSNNNNNNQTNNHKTFTDDHMAKSVKYFHKFATHIHLKFRHLKNNKIYLFLTTTTQPAHVITIAIISFVLLVVWPELVGWKNIPKIKQSVNAITANNILTENDAVERKIPNKLIIVIYLGSFATHFGSQIWMTFVSGLSLYFSLPRHLFGQCQQILFPKYFTLNAALSILMLILFVKYFLITWTTTKLLQICTLAVTALIEIVVRLYMAPNLLQLMLQKYRIEGSIGSGTEIGRLVQGDLIQCPHYQRIHGAFRRLHITVAIGNMIAMAASFTHLCYLAAQIQITI